MFDNFKFNKDDLNIYDNEIKDFIPDKIIDNHIHIWERENINLDIAKQERCNKKPWTDIDFFYEFKYSDFYKTIKIAFPEKEYKGIFFGLPLESVNIGKANNYVMKSSKKNSFDFLYMPMPKENVWEADDRLKFTFNKNFLGFKPYPDLAGVEGNEISIYEFISTSVLEMSNKFGLIIVLHLPRKERLRSDKNIEEIIEISKKYKKIKLILAHSGRSFCANDLIKNLDFLKKLENVYFDTALINEYQVFEYLIRQVDINKIIFGTDFPLGLIKGKDVCINNNHYYIAEQLYEWGLGPINVNLVNFTLYVYEEIRSLLYSIRNVKGRYSDKSLEKVFYRNFINLISN